jgi:hypothetical protein
MDPDTSFLKGAPDGVSFAVTDIKGSVSLLRQQEQLEEAQDLEARIKEVHPEEELEHGENGSQEVSEDTQVEAVPQVANIPSDA